MNPEKRLVVHFTAAVGFAYLFWFLIVSYAPQTQTDATHWSALKGAVILGTIGLIQAGGLRIASRSINVGLYAACSMLAGVSVFAAAQLIGLSPGANDFSQGSFLQVIGFGAVLGASLGALQLPALLPAIRRGWLWPVVSATAWALAALLERLFALLAGEFGNADDQQYALLPVGILASITIGGISGAAAILLTKPGENDERTR